jgi:hypothetical protein
MALKALQSTNWRAGGPDGQQIWLSMLVDAMENVASVECGELQSDEAAHIALHAQLSRPALPHTAGAVSAFSLRN